MSSAAGEGDAKQQTAAAVQLCCEVTVELSTDHVISDVLLTVDADQPLAIHPCIFRWAEIGVCMCKDLSANLKQSGFAIYLSMVVRFET